MVCEFDLEALSLLRLGGNSVDGGPSPRLMLGRRKWLLTHGGLRLTGGKKVYRRRINSAKGEKAKTLRSMKWLNGKKNLIEEKNPQKKKKKHGKTQTRKHL